MIKQEMHYGVWSIGLSTLPWPTGDFLKDQQWGNLLQRMHHGESTRGDMKLINSRVVGENLALPSFEELHGNDVSYTCYTNADRSNFR